jgi:serine/threonine protein kinase/formylglycine-generating enzyme required for sulfatase activity
MSAQDSFLPEEPFASRLASYLEDLVAGHPSDFQKDDVPTEWLPHLDEVVDCVLLLERVWPSSTFAGERAGRTEEVPTCPMKQPASRAIPPVQVQGFEILGLIGQGGMGIVYRARKTRGLHREVALKILPAALTGDPLRLQRFRNEAEIAAGLTDSRILPVLDLLEEAEGPVLVMPYIEGCDLGRILTDRKAVLLDKTPLDPHPWATLSDGEFLEQVLPLLDKLIEAVTVVQRAGVLHRDIKPSNILVDRNGNVWLSDFGLARLAGYSGLTSPGAGMGSPGYMSPEQWEGREDLNERADVFGLGATLYRTLTLNLPYGTGRVTRDSPAPDAIHAQQPLLSSDFDLVVGGALDPDQDRRYPTAAALLDDWRRVRQGQPPTLRRVSGLRRLVRRARRSPWVVSTFVLLGLFVGTAAFFGLRGSTPVVPDGAKNNLPVCRDVYLTTKPEGARVMLVPVDENHEYQPARAIRPSPEQKTPMKLAQVPAGMYLVVAEIPDYGFHEVYRVVPGPDDSSYIYAPQNWREGTDGTINLATIRILPEKESRAGMVYFAGGDFLMGPDVPDIKTTSPQHQRRVDPYYLDATEVTVSAYKKSGLVLPKAMLDRHQVPPEGFDQFAVANISFEQAADFAERVGKRLPLEAEYEFAATLGGKQLYPWGDEADKITEWTPRPVGQPEYDRTPGPTPVYGLYSNVAEWIDAQMTPYDPAYHPLRQKYPPQFLADLRISRVIRGAPPSVLAGFPPNPEELRAGARFRLMHRLDYSSPLIGFRCARSERPRFLD